MPEVLQVPWLMVDEPSTGAQVWHSDGGRLWFVTKCRDYSGSMEVGISQSMAVKLAQVAEAQEFARKHEDNALGFPLFVHARISRTVKTGKARA